jgi:uncharacterized protein
MIFTHIKEFVQFMFRPNDISDKNNRNLRFISVLLFTLFSIAILSVIRDFFINLISIKPIPYSQLFNHFNRWSFLLIGCIGAPITEEFAFRLHLRFRPLYISIFISLQFYLWSAFLAIPIIFRLILIVILFFSTFYFFLKESRREKLHQIWLNKYKYVFYNSSLLFGVIHIFNYKITFSLILLSFFIVLPQIFLGFSLGYIRIKNGIIWSIAFHSIWNILMLSPTIIKWSTDKDNYFQYDNTITISTKSPSDWIKYSYSDISKLNLHLVPKRNYIERYDFILQLKLSKELPEYPFGVIYHYVNKKKSSERIKNEIVKLQQVLYKGDVIDDNIFMQKLKVGQLLADSSNSRIFYHLLKNDELNGTLHVLKVTYLKEEATYNLEFYIPESKYNQYYKTCIDMLLYSEISG